MAIRAVPEPSRTSRATWRRPVRYAMWLSRPGYSSSSARAAGDASSPGSRSIIRVPRWGASRAAALPKPQSVAPVISPDCSRSSTWAPRVTSERPFAGVTPASSAPWTSARTEAPDRFASSATSAVVAQGPWPSIAARCTMPWSGTPSGNPSRSARHDARRSARTKAGKTPGPSMGSSASGASSAASTTVWFRDARVAASAAPAAPRPGARIHAPGGRAASAGPRATTMPGPSGRPASDVSAPRTRAPSKPASPSARPHAAGAASAWSGRYASANRHQPSRSPKVRSWRIRPRTSSSATSRPEGARSARQWARVSPRSRVAWRTFAAMTRSWPCGSKPWPDGSASMSRVRYSIGTPLAAKRDSASAKNPAEMSVNR